MGKLCAIACLLLCCITAVPAFGVELKKPNATITETLVGFGSDPQRSEQSALSKAQERAIDGDYELKNIGISGNDDLFFCTIVIEHKIFIDEDEKKTQEMTVGYGSTRERALLNAGQKAKQMITEAHRSLARIGDEAEDGAESRERAQDTTSWLKSVRFTSLDGEWLCYIKFEYLIDREVD